MKATGASKKTHSSSVDTLPEEEQIMMALVPDVNEDLLADWHSVYEGFDEDEIAEIEAIVLNRDNWREKEVSE